MQNPGTPRTPFRGTAPGMPVSRNSPFGDPPRLSPVPVVMGQPGQMQPMTLQPRQISTVRHPTGVTIGQPFLSNQNVVSGIGHTGQQIGQYIVGTATANQPRLAICFSQGQLTTGQMGQPMLGQTSSTMRMPLNVYRQPSQLPIPGQQGKMGTSPRHLSQSAQQIRQNSPALNLQVNI